MLKTCTPFLKNRQIWCRNKFLELQRFLIANHPSRILAPLMHGTNGWSHFCMLPQAAVQSLTFFIEGGRDMPILPTAQHVCVWNTMKALSVPSWSISHKTFTSIRIQTSIYATTGNVPKPPLCPGFYWLSAPRAAGSPFPLLTGSKLLDTATLPSSSCTLIFLHWLAEMTPLAVAAQAAR